MRAGKTIVITCWIVFFVMSFGSSLLADSTDRAQKKPFLMVVDIQQFEMPHRPMDRHLGQFHTRRLRFRRGGV